MALQVLLYYSPVIDFPVYNTEAAFMCWRSCDLSNFLINIILQNYRVFCCAYVDINTQQNFNLVRTILLMVLLR